MVLGGKKMENNVLYRIQYYYIVMCMMHVIVKKSIYRVRFMVYNNGLFSVHVIMCQAQALDKSFVVPNPPQNVLIPT